MVPLLSIFFQLLVFPVMGGDTETKLFCVLPTRNYRNVFNNKIVVNGCLESHICKQSEIGNVSDNDGNMRRGDNVAEQHKDSETSKDNNSLDTYEGKNG